MQINEKVGTTFQSVLRNSFNKLRYRFKEIKKPMLAAMAFSLCVVYAQAQIKTQPLVNSTLTGRVLDAKDKQPIPGAIVHIQGTTHEVVTDDQGRFNFVTGQKFPYTLLVSYVGYKKTEVIATGKHLDIELEETANNLNDLVVVGYGTQKKSDLTGSISTISQTALKQPVSSLDQALKGAAAGVQVTQTSGQPGGGVSIRIRGGSSIQGGNEPLYVIDGFPVYNSPTTSGVVSGTLINPLSSINPADIETIDILKDASATAIYGSRGANGVVIVTTKKGKADRAAINYEGSVGVQSLRKKIDLLNARDFAILRNDALYDATPANGRFQYLSQAQINNLGAGTDWQDEAFRSANTQNHNLSVSGGNSKTRYLLSGNYFSQDGIVKNTDFSRLSFRANVDANPFEKLKISTSLNFSKSDANLSPSGIISGLLTMPATASVYQPNGTYTLRNPFENIFANPIASLNEQVNKSTTNRLLGTAFAEYTIIPGLNVKVLFGTDINNGVEKSYIPATIYEGSLTNGTAARGALNSYSWLNENTITYNKTIGKNNFDLLAGFTQQEYRIEEFNAGAQNFILDDLSYNSLQSGSTLVRPASDASQWILHSYLGRINYNYDRRYFLTASLRADGSSRFGAGNKWGYFPSAALSWKLSSEKFFQPLLKTFSDLKLRASFGTTGNLEIGEYQSLATLGTYTYIIGGNILTGFAPTRIANDQLSWETTYQYNTGLDIGLFNNRIQLTLDAYYKKTTDLLLNVELPWTTGQTSVLQNFGSVSNKGFEIGLNTRNLTDGFTWNTNVNFSVNRNKVLTIGNGATSYITGNYIIRVGEPLGSFYGTVTDGILQTGEEAAKGKYTGSAVPKAGDRIYKDLNGDGTFTTALDRTIIGNAQPDFIFGLTNTFEWRGIDLSIFIQGAYGNQILNANKQTLELFTGQQNASASALDRWTPTNPSQTIPRAKLDPAPVFSDRFIEDGSFLRLKNVNLGYTLPKAFTQKAKINNIYFYVSGQNLLTWTKYTGFDPEITSGSNVSPGTDSGIYPVSRAIYAGIKITL
ncbi:TonB-dependent receptor [Pedobacter frigidisoli]|uniref:SusC/RagA family TonB-linked outer membrane protein n=1 Tax=Pedobacter frigidisoli TaxID=2530455 RepID=UPI00292DC5A9|nr:TonB-dependent receptor [Pedobacter frigidisoli]